MNLTLAARGASYKPFGTSLSYLASCFVAITAASSRFDQADAFCIYKELLGLWASHPVTRPSEGVASHPDLVSTRQPLGGGRSLHFNQQSPGQAE